MAQPGIVIDGFLSSLLSRLLPGAWSGRVRGRSPRQLRLEMDTFVRNLERSPKRLVWPAFIMAIARYDLRYEVHRLLRDGKLYRPGYLVDLPTGRQFRADEIHKDLAHGRLARKFGQSFDVFLRSKASARPPASGGAATGAQDGSGAAKVQTIFGIALVQPAIRLRPDGAPRVTSLATLPGTTRVVRREIPMDVRSLLAGIYPVEGGGTLTILGDLTLVLVDGAGMARTIDHFGRTSTMAGDYSTETPAGRPSDGQRAVDPIDRPPGR